MLAAGEEFSGEAFSIISDTALVGMLADVSLEPLVPPAVEVDSLRLGQLLCSRLCHDLIGPASAINTGEELLAEVDDSVAQEAHHLIAGSARQLAARLSYYRLVFGSGGTGTGRDLVTVSEACAAASELFADSRVVLDWYGAQEESERSALLTLDVARVLLCMVMIGGEALPRGGLLKVRVSTEPGTVRLSVTSEGRGACIGRESGAMLATPEETCLTPQSIAAFYLVSLCARMNARLAADDSAPGLAAIEVAVPGVSSTRCN